MRIEEGNNISIIITNENSETHLGIVCVVLV